MPDDARPARALLDAAYSGTRYLPRMRELLDAALRFEDPEYLALIAEDSAGPVALAMFGTVAGARQCSKLHALVGNDASAIERLAGAVLAVCSDAGERLVVAEVPDDSPFATAAHALAHAGFAREGRIDHLVADGVALQLLVWRRSPPDAP